MHEFSLMANLMRKIETVAQEQQARRVTHVKVILGALSHISPEHFRGHFSHISQNTLAENAGLTILENKDPTDPQAQDIVLDSVQVET